MSTNNNINSFAENMRKTIAQQTNELSLLSAMQRSLTTNDTFVTYEYQDTQGTNSRYQLPSYASIVNRLKSVEESLNTISTGKGTINLNDGSRRTIKLSSIPKTPDQINGLQDPSTFKLDTNWFFENLMFPGLTVDIDLTGQIDDDADRVKVVRVILNSNDDAATTLWNNQISTTTYDYLSLKSLLANGNISYSEDEEIVQLPLVRNTKSGTFQIIQDPDIINGNVWYTLDSITYSTISSEGIDQGKNNILSIGDQLSYSDSIFEIIAINQNSSKVRLKRIVGAALPGVYATLNYYEDPFRSKIISVRVGANEYDIIYVKGISEAYNLQANTWSTPVRVDTNNLLYEDSNGNVTSTSLTEYYSNYVVDWGAKMIDEAKERAVTAWSGQKPNAPTLSESDMRVVQVNTQINAAIDTTTIKNTAALIADDKTKIDSLKSAIADLKSELQNITNISDYNAKQEQINTQTLELQNAQSSYSSNVSAFQSEVRSNGALLTNPKYRIRGFFPVPVQKTRIGNSGLQEEIIGFDIAYRYVKEDNTPVLLNTFTYNDQNTGSSVTGTFSDWNISQSQMKTKVNDGNGYKWVVENVADSTEVNINQIDIPIQKGERVEIKVRSISEAGYPSNPLRSDWSNSIIISFPDNLSSTNEIADLIKDVNDDALTIAINNTLSSSGVTSHLDDTIPNSNSVNGLYFKHIAKNIAYENTDESTGTKVITSISLQDKVDSIDKEFDNVGYLGDIASINYINYDISVSEDE